MTDAPVLARHALVVFLSLDQWQTAALDTASAASSAAQLRDRAILATGMSFTVADARLPDRPLVWVNPAFTASSGYSFDEAVGRNCRFLQGPGTDPEAVAAIREAVAAGRGSVTTLLNHRKDGTAYWNQLSLSPIHDDAGTLTHFVGIQTDVTGRITADRQRDRALEAERAARRDAEKARALAEEAQDRAERAQVVAEQAQARLALLAEATATLAGTLDVAACRQRLLDLVVPQLADWAVLITTTPAGGRSRSRGTQVEEVVARHTDPARAEELDRHARDLHRTLVLHSPPQEVLSGAPARLIADYDSPAHRAERSRWTTDPAVLDASDALGAASMLVVAVPGREDSRDLLLLVRGPGRPRHTEDDLQDAVDLARRAGLILDNARLYEQQHTIAATLQNSLLPSLPTIPGIGAAARYRAGASGAQVGGDFYELINLPGPDLGLAIGDVVGHDVLAAAAMGHLRGLLRACAWDAPEGSRAGDVLTCVDGLLAGLDLTTMATLAYARLTPDDATDDGPAAGNRGWTVDHSSAGHPRLLARLPDGRVTELGVEHDLLLGVAQLPRRSARTHLPTGTTLLGYTDGLVERRQRPFPEGLALLHAAFAAAPADPGGVCDHLLEVMGSEGDDIAVLAVAL